MCYCLPPTATACHRLLLPVITCYFPNVMLLRLWAGDVLLPATNCYCLPLSLALWSQVMINRLLLPVTVSGDNQPRAAPGCA